jgi:hypothetical protein
MGIREVLTERLIDVRNIVTECIMRVRDAMNERPALGIGVGAGVILIAIFFMFVRMHGGGAGTELLPKSAWYTDDDGQSFFVDSADKVSPFDHKGKVAVRACYYTCDGGKTKFLSHLERFTAEGKKAAEETLAKGYKLIFRNGVQVKKPGAPESEWADLQSPQGQKIGRPTCPDGSTDHLEMAVP